MTQRRNQGSAATSGSSSDTTCRFPGVTSAAAPPFTAERGKEEEDAWGDLWE